MQAKRARSFRKPSHERLEELVAQMNERIFGEFKEKSVP